MPTTRANSRAVSVASVHDDTGPVPEPPLEADTTLRPQTLIHSPQPSIGFQPPFIQPQPPTIIPGPQYYPQGSQGPYSPQFPSHGREPQFGSRGPSQGPERRYNSRAPQTEPHEGTPFEEAPNLAVALTLITKELRRRDNPSTRAKVKEPDTFNGSDPKKLNNFILLCSLYFRQNSTYDYDEAKVTFALSYLRGTALEFFEPSLLSMENTPDWLDDWSIFIQTLRTQFGPIDPTADAEDSLDNLKMRDNQHILKYNVDFNRLSIQTGWNDGVLRHRYYSGLAECIKDIMGQQGKPATLL